MTEKKQRFWISKTNSHELYVPIDEMKTYIFSSFESEMDCMRVVRALNELAEENERLKKERNHFERKKTEYLTEWNTCRIQNTELKNLIQEAYNTERTQIGRNTLKQLLEQI